MELLIRDLLEYTRAAAVSQEERVEPVDGGRVLSDVVLNLRGAIEAAQARVHWEDLPRLLVKEVHLVQLFQNVVGNAIKYRGTDPPVVEVTAAAEPGDMWTISIRDNGIGIDPQFADQVFGIFKRLHRSDQYSGTGIGLAICHKIVHRYGGRIWVESAGEGTGSTFRFTLPGVE
jgi:light-regulated signal transduction histidine kinase (bacteriophytochrome)